MKRTTGSSHSLMAACVFLTLHLAAAGLLACSPISPARISSWSRSVPWHGPFDATVLPAIPEELQVFVVPDTDAGPCNPLCKGWCMDQRCYESPVDAAFVKDAGDMKLSKSRMALTLDATWTRNGRHLTVRPRWGTWQPDMAYTVLVTGPYVRDEVQTARFSTGPLDAPDGTYGPEPVYPAPGQKDVPVNITWTVLAMPVPSFEPELVLTTDSGDSIPIKVSGSAFRCPKGWCSRYLLYMPLEPDQSYTLRAPASSRRVHPWLKMAWFTTGTHSWLVPPAITGLEAQNDGRCLTVSWKSDVPLLAMGRGADSDWQRSFYMPGEGSMILNSTRGAIIFTGMEGTSFMTDTMNPPPAFTWSSHRAVMDTIVANPADREPDCELVTIRNLEAHTLPIDGWMLTDSPETLPDDDDMEENKLSGTIPGYGTAAIVTRNFSQDLCPGEMEAVNGTDTVIVTGRRIAGRGLVNSSGQELFLLDGEGRVVDRYGGWFSASGHEGQGLVRQERTGCESALSWEWKNLTDGTTKDM